MNAPETSILRVLALSILVFLVGTSGLEAQDAVVDVAELEAAVLAHEPASESERQALRDLLADPDVREFFTDRGIDPERAERAVEMLDEGDLEGLAPLIEALESKEDVQSAMQTRATITISAGALLLALLLVLLLA